MFYRDRRLSVAHVPLDLLARRACIFTRYLLMAITKLLPPLCSLLIVTYLLRKSPAHPTTVTRMVLHLFRNLMRELLLLLMVPNQ